MTDQEILHRFEAGNLEANQLNHDTFVRLIWLSLHTYSYTCGLNKFKNGLRRLEEKSKSKNFCSNCNETRVHFYFNLIAERMDLSPHIDSWEAFEDEHKDLLDHEDHPEEYYRKETLESDEASKEYIEPELATFFRRMNASAAV